MNDTYVTVSGNVMAVPTHVQLESGVHLLSMRVASTSRRYDRAQGEWRDASTLHVTVSCWRALAENVAASVGKGDPVVVTGKLRVRSVAGKDGVRRASVEIEATAVGHDLARGVTRFQKAGSRASVAGRQAAEEPLDARAVAERGGDGSGPPKAAETGGVADRPAA